MINKDLESITKTAYKRVGLVLIVAAVTYYVLCISKVLRKIANSGMYLLFLLSILNSTLCFISISTKATRIPPLFVLSLSLSIVNVFPNVEFSFVFLIPVFLSIYSLKPKIIIVNTVFTLVFKIVSTIIKELYSSRFFTTRRQVTDKLNLAIIICIISMHLLETLFLLSVFIPIFRYLIELKNSQEKTIKEKEKATNELLEFCSTATGYHNKYLKVHLVV